MTKGTEVVLGSLVRHITLKKVFARWRFDGVKGHENLPYRDERLGRGILGLSSMQLAIISHYRKAK